MEIYIALHFIALINWILLNDHRVGNQGGEDDSTPDFVLIDDMILSPQQYDVLFTEPSRRNGFTRAVRIWPNASVPYMIDGNYSKFWKHQSRLCLSIEWLTIFTPRRCDRETAHPNSFKNHWETYMHQIFTTIRRS